MTLHRLWISLRRRTGGFLVALGCLVAGLAAVLAVPFAVAAAAPGAIVWSLTALAVLVFAGPAIALCLVAAALIDTFELPRPRASASR